MPAGYFLLILVNYILMFGLFRKNKARALPPLYDLNKQPLREGDLVESLRYELGKCRLILEENTYHYISLQSGEKVSYHLMIDAATEMQKVRKTG